MNSGRLGGATTRRELLRLGSSLAGAAAVTYAFPASARSIAKAAGPAQQQASGTDVVAQMRAQMATVPLQQKKLRDNVYWFYGPGGNMVLLTGADGKALVDTSVSPVAPKLLAAFAAIDNAPLKIVINTHWHLDHTDGNAAMHDAGGLIIAHENTRKRLAAPQTIAAFGLHTEAAPANALPQSTFTDGSTLYFDGEQVELGYIEPAHTDSDIYVRYHKANVLHCGDVYFNGIYPFIDGSTGGKMDGMIAGATKCISLSDSDTIVIPGHGPAGDRASLTKYRDMLASVREKVKPQKDAGKSLAEVVASKPTASFDAEWGKGMMGPDQFAGLVYSTL